MGMRQHSGPIPAKPILHFSSDMLKRVGTPGTPSPVGNSNWATLKFKKTVLKWSKKTRQVCAVPQVQQWCFPAGLTPQLPWQARASTWPGFAWWWASTKQHKQWRRDNLGPDQSHLMFFCIGPARNVVEPYFVLRILDHAVPIAA